MNNNSERLESALGYSFSDPEHLEQALRHRSWVAETGVSPSNERLEFLGDTILQLVVTDFIFAQYPTLPEGELAKLRSSAVNKRVLYRIAEGLHLGDHLILGKAEDATGGRKKRSLLADAMEAVLGAVYLDGGLDAARRLILELWKERIMKSARQPGRSDYKSRLQEELAQRGAHPEYCTSAQGPDHCKVFTSVVSFDGEEQGSGTGSSKRASQQEAARAALKTLLTTSADPS